MDVFNYFHSFFPLFTFITCIASAWKWCCTPVSFITMKSSAFIACCNLLYFGLSHGSTFTRAWEEVMWPCFAWSGRQRTIAAGKQAHAAVWNVLLSPLCEVMCNPGVRPGNQRRVWTGVCYFVFVCCVNRWDLWCPTVLEGTMKAATCCGARREEKSQNESLVKAAKGWSTTNSILSMRWCVVHLLETNLHR